MKPLTLETGMRLAFTDAVITALKKCPSQESKGSLLDTKLFKQVVQSNKSGKGQIHRKKMWHVQRDSG